MAERPQPAPAALERAIGHRFRQDLSLAEVRQALADGDRVPDWLM
jgi:hypothetical protein